MIIKCVAVMLSCFICSWGLEIGDTCMAEGNTAGTCKPIAQCPFAYRQLQNFKKPKMCRWMNGTRIVCCPPSNLKRPIGVFRTYYFEATQKGILAGPNMTCRYNGEMPVLCCQNTKDVSPPPEPPLCPPLDPPSSKPTDIAFEKCLEYRRYVSPCVADKTQEDKLVRADTCGITQSANFMWKGTPAGPKEFPHMALLSYGNLIVTDTAPLQWLAVGTLISDKYILTAAHVLTHNDYGPIRYALLGVTNKTQARDGVLYRIINTIAHKLYEKNQKPHDIALLELDRRVRLDEHIRPACLPSPGLEVMGNIRTVAEWGWPDIFSVSAVLLKVNVDELDYETECKARLPDNVNSVFRNDSMLCAGPTEIATCPGENGSALLALARDLHCTYIVRGLMSDGPWCGQMPRIYTDVRAHLPWIIENVWRK